MPKKKTPSAQQVMEAALAAQIRSSRSKAADYREAILILLQKSFSHGRIAEFLRGQGVKVSQTAISDYLRKHQPTEQEIAGVRRVLTPQIPASENERPPVRRRPMAGTHPSKMRTEPEDDTDYSFLNVQGRPFTIREEEEN